MYTDAIFLLLPPNLEKQKKRVAPQFFEAKTGLTVQATGLHIDFENCLLTASPDGEL